MNSGGGGVRAGTVAMLHDILAMSYVKEEMPSPSLYCADVQGLQGALTRAFPECSDLSDDPGRGIAEFAPHLSVANVGVKADRVEEHKEALGAKWETLSFEVAEVCIISRSGFDDPFATRFRVPLGGGRPEASGTEATALSPAAASSLEPSGASMEDLKEPYVASVGSEPDTQASICRGVVIFPLLASFML